MRNLSDTIARLSALRAQHAPRTVMAGNPGRLKTLSGFGPNPGGLEARIHVPENLPDQAPLVVVLHGCTQDASGYDHGSGWSKLADEAGFAVLFPEQTRANNPNLCFNWFQPGDNRRGAGEAASIAQMIEALVEAKRLDGGRIYITGLSAGGAMASVMLASYPELFAGGAVIAGLPHGVANTVPEAFDRMRGHGMPSEAELQALLRRASPQGASARAADWPRIAIWQGTADQTVAASNAEAIAAQWRGVHDVAAGPIRSEAGRGHSRLTWTDGEDRPLIEINMVAGMGHGTPLAASGPDGLGAAGPFLLDVGIASTREIARFWGIAAAAETRSRATPSAAPRPAEPRILHGTILGPGTEEAPADRRPHPAEGVRKVIEDALRKAGLMP